MPPQRKARRRFTIGCARIPTGLISAAWVCDWIISRWPRVPSRISARNSISGADASPAATSSTASPSRSSPAAIPHAMRLQCGSRRPCWRRAGSPWNWPSLTAIRTAPLRTGRSLTAHHTTLQEAGPNRADFVRSLDADRYAASLAWTGAAALKETAPHTFVLTAASDASAIELVCAFRSKPDPAARALFRGRSSRQHGALGRLLEQRRRG